MSKIKFLIMFFFFFYSCGNEIKPDVEVQNDITLNINGENIDGIIGEWIISVEEVEQKIEENSGSKEVIIITVEKKELDKAKVEY
jgi:hypothetical protein|tara:strand:+ start:969 stop:1223 length:255 start_codon:yes stop_codon:yes gene_type:complete